MRKSINAILFILICGTGLFAQNVTLVKEFSFGNPFVFATRWDENEGPTPGPGPLFFLNNNTILTTDGISESFIFFDKDWNIVKTYSRGWGMDLIFVGYKHLLIGTFGNVNITEPIWLFPKGGPYDNPIKLASTVRYGSSGMLTTGKWVFNLVRGDKLISWEIVGGGKAPLYRNQEATEKLLLQEGVGTELGYSQDAPPYGLHQFGSSFVTFMHVSDPVVPQNFHGYSYDSNRAEALGLDNSRPGMPFMGFDAKRLYYFWKVTPQLLGTDEDPNPTYTNPNKRLVFGIADPWTKRLIFRALPPGAWTPPVSVKRGLLGTYPTSVDRKGQIYFFDADQDRKVYELKRISNDWWKDLGVDSRKVGVVTENRVRIRDNPGTQSTIVGYVYENEYAWVQEQSTKKDTISGSTAPWYRIEMPDGRKGWIFGEFVDIQR